MWRRPPSKSWSAVSRPRHRYGGGHRGRLIRARQEYQEADFYDYLIVNDDADKPRSELNAIIDAEHCRFADRADWLKNL